MTLRLTHSTQRIELRWPTLATLALCTLLPGCPMTDNYFIDRSSAGAAQMMTNGGASELNTSGASSIAGGPEAGGSMAGGAEVHPAPGCTEPVCTDPSGGGTDAGAGSPDAGSGSDAGSSDAGGASAGTGGAGGSGGLTNGGGSNGGNSNGGSSIGGAGTAGGPTLPQPACDDGVSKGDACTGSSLQFCYKGCGPDNVGYKPLACQSGMYDETQSGCTFPAAHDYSCYKVPPSLPTECPSGTPRGGRACQLTTCTVCFGGSVWNPQYQDSTGMTKQGYCVCSEAGVWTCGSSNGSWPCPGNVGCP